MQKDFIDAKIDELLRKPASPEIQNALGDLYLRKGHRVKAVSCYYQAVDMLHSGQKDKKIAIFKKILKVSPSEEMAYEGITALFAKMGLHAEEKKYLLRLIQLCQTKGEYNRVNSLFRRVQQIDPADTFAATYFQQGKRAPLDLGAPVSDDEDQRDVAVASSETGPTDETRSDEELPEEEATEREQTPHRTREFLSMPDAGPTSRLFSPGNRAVMLAGAFCIVLVIVVAAVFAVRMTRPSKSTSEAWPQALPAIETVVEGYRFSVSEYPRSNVQQLLATDAELEKNRFFLVSVVMPSGCLPEAFAAAPQQNIFWIDENNALVPAPPVRGIETKTRIIRKLNACGRESAAVSASFVVALPKSARVSAMQAGGLSQKGPLLIQWEPR